MPGRRLQEPGTQIGRPSGAPHPGRSGFGSRPVALMAVPAGRAASWSRAFAPWFIGAAQMTRDTALFVTLVLGASVLLMALIGRL
jgi:hypothetical protein